MKSKKEIECFKEAAKYLRKCADMLDKATEDNRENLEQSPEKPRRICD